MFVNLKLVYLYYSIFELKNIWILVFIIVGIKKQFGKFVVVNDFDMIEVM